MIESSSFRLGSALRVKEARMSSYTVASRAAKLSADSLLLGLSGLVLLSSLALGGGTRNGFLGDVLAQLVSIPLLLFAVCRISGAWNSIARRGAFWFCAALVLVPLVQLIPLPPTVWTALPGRAPIIETFRTLGNALPWMPISVSPESTRLSVLSLLPPLALFLGTLLLSRPRRRLLSLLLVAFGICSVFLGLAQLAQGPSSSLRVFEVTNATEATGLFANRNHYAALLYGVLIFAAVWALQGVGAAFERITRGKIDAYSLLPLLGGFTLLVMIMAAQAMTRSRAGLGLTIIGLIGCLALAYADRQRQQGTNATKLLAGAVAAVLLLSSQTALYRLQERFAEDQFEQQLVRVDIARATLRAAAPFLPFGSGMGTFVPVYAMFEAPETAIHNYVNRAHNDFAELWLEAGVAAPVLIGIFIVWLIRASRAAWRPSDADGDKIDRDLRRAATIVIGLLALHSLVDYPMRTTAIMGMFAFSCALLFEPIGAKEPEPLPESKRVKVKTERRGEAAPLEVPIAAPARSTSNRQMPATPIPVNAGVEPWEPIGDLPQEWQSGQTRTPKRPVD